MVMISSPKVSVVELDSREIQVTKKALQDSASQNHSLVKNTKGVLKKEIHYFSKKTKKNVKNQKYKKNAAAKFNRRRQRHL